MRCSAKVSSLLAIILSAAMFISFGQDAENQKDTKKKVDFMGYSSYSFGQIVEGNNNQSDGMTNIYHYWSQEVYTGVGFLAALNDRFKILAGVEGKMWTPYAAPGVSQRQFKLRNYSLWLDQGNAVYSIGNLEKPMLEMTLGYFKYKYNPEVRNLGEYMFRSTTYPGFIINYFDFPENRLLGYQAHLDLSLDRIACDLKADLLAISESEWYPFGDFSPALLASGNFAKIVEVGGGIEFARLFSVNENRTTPAKNPDGTNNTNNIILKSVTRDENGNAISKTYDSTSHYTFRATKVMGRIMLDPKKAFQASFFGPEDAMLYGEICIIGWDNYSYWYEDRLKRIPFMVGFNVPTFKLLDVLSLEVENYQFPFQTSYKTGVELNSTPLPDDQADNWNPNKYKYDDWKWSVYAKKTLFRGFSITTQFARDHMRTLYSDGALNYTEAVARPGQYYWVLKLGYSL
jgi:hypothetical protein